ncbi:MAG: hypothetical protein ABR574_06740 [Cryomorphaceae bacterium]|nr:hypothetical protein [Flavobacteriales bacterium]
MKFFPILFLCILACEVTAQTDGFRTNAFYDGYIIHTDGSRERGFVQYLNEEDRYEKVVFRKEQNGKKLKYKVKDLNGYMVAETTYRAVEYEDVLFKGRKFLIVENEGCINTYSYTERKDDGTWATITILENDNRAVNTQKFALNFSNSMAELVQDDADLAAKVAAKQKGYRILSMYDIVEEYNENCKNK